MIKGKNWKKTGNTLVIKDVLKDDTDDAVGNSMNKVYHFTNFSVAVSRSDKFSNTCVMTDFSLAKKKGVANLNGSFQKFLKQLIELIRFIKFAENLNWSDKLVD